MISVILPAAAAICLFLTGRYRSSKRTSRTLAEYQMALRLLDQMIQKDPTNAMAFWQKGEVYEAMAMPDRAVRYYLLAHQMCPRAYAYHEYSSAYERLKDNLRWKNPLKIQPLY